MSWHDGFRDILTENRPLRDLTTWRMGGTARFFFEPRSIDETAQLLRVIAREGLSFLVLGGGANLLIDDGVHLSPIIHFSKLAEFEQHGGSVTAGAGRSFPRIVADTAQAGFEGCDVLAGIPGQMGGICAMNAGGRWGEIKDVVRKITFVDKDGEVGDLSRDAIGFRYRGTALPQGAIVRVDLELKPADDPGAPRRRVAEILKTKGAAQPLREPSGGCVFKNPPGDSTGKIVETLGLKGLRIGDAEVSTIHGNFIVNKGCARFDDMLEVMATIERRVFDSRGIRLEREVKIWRSGVGAVGLKG